MICSAGNKGFTIIEVVVGAMILALVALIGITQIRSLTPEQTLENAVDDTRSLLVLARSYAQTGHVCCGDQLPNGYGVIFTLDGTPDTTALLYADLDDSNDYKSSADEVLNTFALPTGTNFVQCEDSISSTTAGDCDLLFQTAEVAQLYSNGTAEVISYVVSVRESTTSAKATIVVNSLGVIE